MKLHALSVILVTAIALAVAGGAACGSSSGAGGDGGAPDANAGAPHSSKAAGREAGSDAYATKLGTTSAPPLEVDPANATLTVTVPGASQQFHAYPQGSKSPVSAVFSADAPSIGSIDASTGLFKATGLIGGTVDITAATESQRASTQLTVFLKLTDNPGMVPAATQSQLLAGGAADSAFAWLYPYDKTVFPQGLMAPTLQFAGTAPDAVLVHISFGELDYRGFYGPSNPGQVTIPASLWTTITMSATATDAVTVELTKISAGQVTGPIRETWTIAQGTLKGTVYYESRYSSPTDNGATMRIKPGASQPDVLLGNCTVCHYVSADGSTIVATNDVTTPITSASYSLTADAGVVSQKPDETYTFAALYGDGSFMMSCGSASIPGIGNDGPVVSSLYDTKTGAQIPAPGWDGVITNGAMPAFSPDGQHIVFNHYDTGMGHSLALMDFDRSTYTFSNLMDIVTDPNNFLGWPTFTPDSGWVVYDADTRSDFATWGVYPGGSTATLAGPNAQSDLQIAQIRSGTTASLDLLNGVSNGTYYLPFGEAAEGHMNYDATVLPIAAGGYFWVVFTSRREYGNTINTPSPYYNLPSNQPGALPWRKKLWVAALDIDSTSTTAHDISHPAFYLPGQDESTGNYRAFWVLDPCASNGTSCASGDQCCSGFCRPAASSSPSDGGSSMMSSTVEAGSSTDSGAHSDAARDAMTTSDGASEAEAGSAPPVQAGPSYVCVVPQACANEYERCTSTTSCCGASQGYQCINGYCSQPGPK